MIIEPHTNQFNNLTYCSNRNTLANTQLRCNVKITVKEITLLMEEVRNLECSIQQNLSMLHSTPRVKESEICDSGIRNDLQVTVTPRSRMSSAWKMVHAQTDSGRPGRNRTRWCL